MKKKYIAPKATLVEIDVESLMTVTSPMTLGDGAPADPNSPMMGRIIDDIDDIDDWDDDWDDEKKY